MQLSNSLTINRLRIIPWKVYQTLNEISPKYIQDMIDKGDCDYNLHASPPLTQPKCNTMSYGLNSFRYKGMKICNSLPNNIKDAISFYFLLNHGIFVWLCWKAMWTMDKQWVSSLYITL